MIGVSVKNGQLAVVEEFFELFKTPWEVCAPGGIYDVVITTRSDIRVPDADLVIAFGSSTLSTDGLLEIVEGTRHRSGTLVHEGGLIPPYGQLPTFVPAAFAEERVLSPQRAVGISLPRGNATVLRIRYDLFAEVRLLPSTAQLV